MAPHRKKKPPSQSLRIQAEAKAEVQAAERRQLELDRMSSYSDDAFECESPHAILASSRVRPEHRSDFHGAVYEEAETSGDDAGGHLQKASPYLVVDNIGRLRVDSASGSDNHDDVAYGELAQPRPEIILRWKRFACLVVLTAAVMSAIAAWLREGFVVYQAVAVEDAEDKADKVNSYLGLIMGFIESIVGLGVEEIFPVFIVYLHNLRWYPGDDPATKKQGKFKKFALTIFIPAVMMAVGSSLSAVQANQQDDNVSATNATSGSNTTITTRHLQQDVVELQGGILENSILKTALARKVDPMPPLDASVCSEQEPTAYSDEALLSAAPKAVFGFPLPEWGTEFGNSWYREAPTKQYDVVYSDAEDMGRGLNGVMPLATAYELWVQGSTLLRKTLRATQNTAASVPPSSTGMFLEDVLASLGAMGLPLAVPSKMNASFETIALNSLMDMDAVTLQIPLSVPTNASVVCGSDGCALLEPWPVLGERLPRKQIGMMRLERNCSLSDDESATYRNCEVVPNAAFLYGFTTVTTAASNGENGLTTMTRSLVLSLARLSWRFDTAAYACGTGASQNDDCQVLHQRLDDNNRHLVLPKLLLPTQLQRGGLVSPVPLVQLLQPKIRLHPDQSSRFATLEHLSKPLAQKVYPCSSVVDTYLRYMNSNQFYMGDDMLDTMAASALIFLFQSARVLDAAPGEGIAMMQRRLTDTGRRVKVFLSNTPIGNACTWTGCGVLLILTILVLVLPNERARLSPPRGGNARAERFVAVQTEQIYPNLIYKKRFLIGKTGEEIKFGEFAVESVGLHHKMEEDEQIYI